MSRAWHHTACRAKLLRRVIAAGALACAFAAPSAADALPQADVNSALRGNTAIYNGLFTAAVIRHITNACPDLQGPNRLQRVSFFVSLYNQARGMGFTRAQIEAFVEDDAEQARLQSVVDRHFRDQGVDPSQDAAVCAFARQQMDERTALGRRLRER